MICYQTREDGVFVGVAFADPNPLEEGQWLLPGGCVLSAPPAIPDGKQARWDGSAWAVEDLPQPEPAVPETPPVELTPQQKLALIGLTVADLKALLSG